MRPSHASSTLFPYTPLFRSQPLNCSDDSSLRLVSKVIERAKYYLGLRGSCFSEHSRHRPVENAQRSTKDRKSTRLNSSHVRISYAVFCLKKKTHDELVE